jgi:hypothetical protein
MACSLIFWIDHNAEVNEAERNVWRSGRSVLRC